MSRLQASSELRPIEDVAEELGIELDDTGSVERRALCPVHEDTAPSLYINVRDQVWYCHGCGVGGDAAALARHVGGDCQLAYSEGTRPVQYNLPFPRQETVEERFAAIGRVAALLPPPLLRAIDTCVVREDDTSLATLLDRAMVVLFSRKKDGAGS